MDLTFLDKIEIIEEKKGREEAVKSIRFSKDEFYMLKYCKFLNKKFSTLVKDLINESIIELQNEGSVKKDISVDLSSIKDELKKELKKELLKELNNNNQDEITVEINEVDSERTKAKNEVLGFLNNRK